MQLFSFTPGQPLRLFKDRFVIVSVRNDIVTLRNETTDATKDFELSTLLAHHRARNLRPERPPKKLANRRVPVRVRRTTPLLADASTKALETGRRFHAYLKAIAQSGVPFKRGDAGLIEVLKEVALARGDASPPGFSSLSRARGRFERAGGDAAACLPRYDLRGGPGKPRFAAGIECALQYVIDNFHMAIEAPPMRESYEEFRRDIISRHALDEGFDESQLPSYWTFRRRVLARSGFELYAARNGERAAEKAFRHSQPSFVRPGLNEVWEIDHTRLDLLIVDSRGGLTARRPRLTVILEACTRAVMGFDVDFTGDSSQAVLNALRHAITPKTYVQERYPDIKHFWPCYGAPLRLRCDNGQEFHSESVKRACEELGISDIEYCPMGRPTSKGRVERFFRTLSEGFLRGLPGYAGPNLKRRKELEDISLPVIDLDTFMHMLHLWVIEAYMQTQPRRGGAMSPMESWGQLATPDRLYLPMDPDEIEIVCSDVYERTISHTGIEWNGTMFHSHALQELRKRLPANQSFRVAVRNNGHMARIWVKDPADDTFLEVLNADPNTKDLTVRQVRDLNAVQGNNSSASRLSAAEARKRLRDWSRQLMECKSKSSKRALLRLLHLIPIEEGRSEPAPLPTARKRANEEGIAGAIEHPRPQQTHPAQRPKRRDAGAPTGSGQRVSRDVQVSSAPVFKTRVTHPRQPGLGDPT